MRNENESPLARTAALARPPARLRAAAGEVRTWEDPYSPIQHSPPGCLFIVAQLGQSLDGRIATVTGDSQSINGSSALDHLHRLRALVDAVIVGAGTVIADNPLLTVRRVPGRNPARVVIDPTGRAPANARCLARDGARRIVITAGDLSSADGVEVISLSRRGRNIDCKEIADALFSRGLKRLLIEGGSATVSAFIDAGIIDRLHLLVAPMILGSGKIGLELAPIARIAQAPRPQTRVYQLPGGDVLFDCDLRAGK